MADFIGKENMPTEQLKEKAEAQEYQFEIDYDVDVESEKASKNKDLLNEGQRKFVQSILEAAGVGPNGDMDEGKATGKRTHHNDFIFRLLPKNIIFTPQTFLSF